MDIIMTLNSVKKNITSEPNALYSSSHIYIYIYTLLWEVI